MSQKGGIARDTAGKTRGTAARKNPTRNERDDANRFKFNNCATSDAFLIEKRPRRTESVEDFPRVLRGKGMSPFRHDGGGTKEREDLVELVENRI